MFSKTATLFILPAVLHFPHILTKHLLQARLVVSSHILFVLLSSILYFLMENFEQDYSGQRPEQLALEEEDLWL